MKDENNDEKMAERVENNYKKLDKIKEMINVKDIKVVTDRYPMSIQNITLILLIIMIL